MILAGDFVPLKTPPLIPDFGDELILANLEGPVCDDGLKPLAKAGPSLFSRPFDIPGRWAFSLANNHMMDYGEDGLHQTKSFLCDHKYEFAGAGANIEESRRPMILEESGKKIAVISCCEKQFGVAGYNRCGVAAKGLWIFDAITAAKRDGADYVVVSCHAAAELSPFPSPAMQDFYRLLVDAGANIIHGHHSHVPQGFEEYEGGLITYGLGNFVVDPDAGWRANPNCLWSLIVRLDFGGDKIRWRIEPSGTVPVFADEYIRTINDAIAHRALLEGAWQEIAIQLLGADYAPMMRLPPNCGFRQGELLHLVGVFRSSLGRVKRNMMGAPTQHGNEARLFWHYFACESHCQARARISSATAGGLAYRSRQLKRASA